MRALHRGGAGNARRYRAAGRAGGRALAMARGQRTARAQSPAICASAWQSARGGPVMFAFANGITVRGAALCSGAGGLALRRRRAKLRGGARRRSARRCVSLSRAGRERDAQRRARRPLRGRTPRATWRSASSSMAAAAGCSRSPRSAATRRRRVGRRPGALQRLFATRRSDMSRKRRNQAAAARRRRSANCARANWCAMRWSRSSRARICAIRICMACRSRSAKCALRRI